jgi:hypothetical protein
MSLVVAASSLQLFHVVLHVPDAAAERGDLLANVGNVMLQLAGADRVGAPPFHTWNRIERTMKATIAHWNQSLISLLRCYSSASVAIAKMRFRNAWISAPAVSTSE